MEVWHIHKLERPHVLFVHELVLVRPSTCVWACGCGCGKGCGYMGAMHWVVVHVDVGVGVAEVVVVPK